MKRERRRLQLLKLPVEILVDILLRLPMKKVACVKCVSKTLSKMVSDISFSTLHARLWPAAVADQVPLLMYCSRSRNLLTLQSLKYKDKTLTKGRRKITLSSSTPGFMRFVFHNILCLGFSWTGCTLVNSLGERGVLRLPECSFARQEIDSLLNTNCWFGMGFDDKTNTCKILCVTTHERDDHRRHTPMTTAHVLVLGTNSWRQISSLPPHEFSCMNMEAMPVYANGAAHWLTGTQRDRIVSFDFRKEEFCWTPTPPTLQSSSKHWLDSNWNLSLCTLKGCLAIVGTKSSWSFSSDKMNMEIWVLKDFDQQEKLWELYYNGILDYFPSHSLMPPGEWEHGIFFTIYYNFWKASVFFIDLKFGSVNRVAYPFTAPASSAYNEEEDLYIGTYSYPETLISLKDYGDLEDAHHHVIT